VRRKLTLDSSDSALNLGSCQRFIRSSMPRDFDATNNILCRTLEAE
jgi:hypothetical protein